MAQKSSDRRSKHESQAEGRTHHAHTARPVLRGRRVGNVGLCRCDVRPGDAGRDPRREQQPQRLGESEDHVGHEGSEQPDEQNGPAPNPIGQPSPDRREQELHQRVRGREQTNGERRGTEGLGVERQQRDDDAEAKEIDEDSDEDDHERRHIEAVPQVRSASGLGFRCAAPPVFVL